MSGWGWFVLVVVLAVAFAFVVWRVWGQLRRLGRAASRAEALQRRFNEHLTAATARHAAQTPRPVTAFGDVAAAQEYVAQRRTARAERRRVRAERRAATYRRWDLFNR